MRTTGRDSYELAARLAAGSQGVREQARAEGVSPAYVSELRTQLGQLHPKILQLWQAGDRRLSMAERRRLARLAPRQQLAAFGSCALAQQGAQRRRLRTGRLERLAQQLEKHRPESQKTKIVLLALQVAMGRAKPSELLTAVGVK